MTLYPRRIPVTKLRDDQEAQDFLEHPRRLINEVWTRREEITPSYKTRAKLTALAIYAHLPKTNGGQCGEPTCMAFAWKLLGEGKKLGQCAPLLSEAHQERREKLIRLLTDAGYKI